MKTKSTKRALLSAILALVMTVSMLVGTTFAWFTDSVTSAGNKIVAGNLDVELYMFDGTSYVDISDETRPIFGEGGLIDANENVSNLWEPGKTQVVYLAIKNAGSLALKYKVSLNVTDITKSFNDVLTYTITPDAKADEADKKVTAWDGTGAKSVVLGQQLVSATSVPMQSGDMHYFALSVHMDELANNDYMDATITFDLTVLATQLDSELDSFGSDYDKTYSVGSAEELVDAIKANGAIELTNDITLPADFTTLMAGTRSGSSYTGDAFKGTLDGNGFTISGVSDTVFGVIDGATISNLKIEADINKTGDSIAALAGIMIGGEISNVTVEGSVVGDEAVGGVVGRILANGVVKNCVNNAAVVSTGSGDAAGGIVGKAYYTSTEAEMNIIGCENNGAVKSGYAAGGIAGFSSANIVDCVNTADVEGAISAGGIVGEQTNYGEIKNNTNKADVVANNANGKAGGIIGWLRYQNSASSYPASEIVEISSNKSSGNASGGNSAGGIVGLAYNQAKVYGNTVYAEVIDAGVFAAGVVGGLQVDNANLTIASAVRFEVSDNTVTAGSITANCTSDFAYNNGPHDPAFAKIENNVKTDEAFVFDTAAAQAALDEAVDGEVIQLVSGVDYGTLYIRPVVGNANTEEVDVLAAYRNEQKRSVKNLTIKGAEGAKVDAIVFETGYTPAQFNYLEVEGLTIEGIDFTDRLDGSSSGLTYNSPLLFNLTYAKFDGITVKDCTLIGNNDKLNLVYLYNEENTQYGADAVKNLTITGCHVSGIARLCELRACENVTITNNVIENTAMHAMLLTAHGDVNGGTYSGDIVIEGNTAKGINERFVRMAYSGAANISIKNNVIEDYAGNDEDIIKVTNLAAGVSAEISGNKYVVSDTEGANKALTSVRPGEVIELKSGRYDTLTVKNFWGGNYTQTGVESITIKAAENADVTVGAIDLNGMNFVNIEGITFDAAGAVQVYNNDGATGDVGNIVDSANEESKSRGANHIKIVNCRFVGEAVVDISKYCPINFMGSNRSSWTYNIKVEGCSFEVDAQNFIRMNNITNNGVAEIINNKFGTENTVTNHHAINASANGGDWYIKGNTFMNWNPKKTAFATGRSTADGTTDFYITGNTFINTRLPGDGDDGVIEIKTNSYAVGNYTIDFSGNVFGGALEGKDENTIKWIRPGV